MESFKVIDKFTRLTEILFDSVPINNQGFKNILSMDLSLTRALAFINTEITSDAFRLLRKNDSEYLR